MKAIVRTKNVTLEVEGELQKDLFEQCSQAREVFGEEACGLCGSEDIAPVVRKLTHKKKELKYYEYHCRRCGARLSLSLNMEGGTLFVNRELLANGQPATGENRGQGKRGPHRGWTQFKGAVESKED